MSKTTSAAALVAATLLAACAAPETPQPGASASMAPPTPILLSACVSAVTASKPGDILELDGLLRDGKELYEFEVKGTDGKTWEVVCDPATSQIVEVEEEVADARADAFKAVAKVTLAEAEQIALAKYPGTIRERDFEIEADGKASYELEIVGTDGKVWEIEVDAATGEIVEADLEIYEIGDDGD